MPRISFLLVVLCLPLIVGCEGCRRDPQSQLDEEQKKKEAAKEDFSSRPPLPFPADASLGTNAIKPGHWTTASQTLQANKFDTRGDLVSRVGLSGVSMRSGSDTTLDTTVPNQRPVVMPKGQRRRFDYRLLPPLPTSVDQKRCYLSSRFVSAGQGTFYEGGRQPFVMMRPEEYFFVILTSRPERFSKFKDSDWARPYRGEFDQQAETANYRIIIPDTNDVLPLAETMLDWTSTAVVFWDDLPAESLTPDQLTALRDWLHFGGRLIVNGADATDAVANTSLRDSLPLVPTGNIELDPTAAAEVLSNWQVKTDPSTQKQIAIMQGQSARVAVDGRVAEDAGVVPETGNLIMRRKVGRGVVVQPRFDVTSDWIANWQSYDSFVNAVLIERPRRAYFQAESDGVVRQRYPSLGRLDADAEMNTQLRLFSRDASLRQARPSRGVSSNANIASQVIPTESFVTRAGSGIGGWNDSSDVINLCRDVLRSESGIEIPKSDLVIKSLGIYLILLVPVNYLIFRLMGRLEYAWLAVPVIAIGGAIWVARAARLDIGFARSQTELAVLELQPDYPRGHLSRVIAIYNSLSSSYDIDFKTVDGAAMPMSADRVLDGERSGDDATFRTSYNEGPSLSGMAVGSNQVRLLRTEQMIDVGGGVFVKDDKFVNDSSLDLLDVFVVEKDVTGDVRVAVVGGCSPSQAKTLRFRDTDSLNVDSELPMQTSKIIRQFASEETMTMGTMRMVGRASERLGGIEISPGANQQSSQTIVVAHLKHANGFEQEPDENFVTDFRIVNTLLEEPSDVTSE
ncbi:hypothetical protein Pla22_23460 [Rubripirellula amarantea]|uniref:DUF4350 domain-containing protein n=1 Tax=Rubripirellula amarantea TaxID=2527999 RepID=A0A5C5WXS6_9BACT|nr:hypothetical protein [Rubripirellula amarantea]TWT54695.1 hypothetical protein Pla22_23460 [Rubripirellula amarantea]